MRCFRRDTQGFAAALGSVIALLVSIIVGVLVYFKINSGVFEAAADSHGSSGHQAIGALFNTTNATAGTVFNLMPVTAIVVIAGVILTIVAVFGRQQA